MGMNTMVLIVKLLRQFLLDVKHLHFWHLLGSQTQLPPQALPMGKLCLPLQEPAQQKAAHLYAKLLQHWADALRDEEPPGLGVSQVAGLLRLHILRH